MYDSNKRSLSALLLVCFQVFLLVFGTIGVAKVHGQIIMNIQKNDGTVLQFPLNTIDSITYTLPEPGELATITTYSVTNVNSTSVTAGGNIISDGGSAILQRGFCWSENPEPTLADSFIDVGTGIGEFASLIEGLVGFTTYYLRAFAVNDAGVAYGNEVNFTTTTGIVSNPGPGVFFNGHNYASVVLGNGQEWMAENLRTTSYANGDPISNVSDGQDWQILNTGAWVHYENNSSFENPYGKLYNWHTANDPRNVCPTGWHVPSKTEVEELVEYLGGGAIAGGMLKSTGTDYWEDPNAGASNESGFSALPGGSCLPNGTFTEITEFGVWWTSTEDSFNNSWFFNANYFNAGVSVVPNDKNFGFSIRCLTD